MLVIDASVLVELLVGGRVDPTLLAEEPLAAPHLIDSEVLHALRRLERTRAISAARISRAVERFAHVTLIRFPVDQLLPRIWELRHNLTAYDATYVALAEVIEATCLLTTDQRLARVTGVRCAIELI